MRSAIRLTAVLLGVYVAVLGVTHGYFELQQGDVRTEQIAIHAIGSPCEPGTVWHDCLPAMTLLPSFTWAGISSMIVSAALLLWAGFFYSIQRSGWIMLILAIVLLLVGGGFVAMFVGVVAGFVATRLHNPNHLPRFLAFLWPGTLLLYILWIITQWTVGTFFNEWLLSLAGIAFFLDIGLLLLTGLSAIALDFWQQTGAEATVSV